MNTRTARSSIEASTRHSSSDARRNGLASLLLGSGRTDRGNDSCNAAPPRDQVVSKCIGQRSMKRSQLLSISKSKAKDVVRRSRRRTLNTPHHRGSRELPERKLRQLVPAGEPEYNQPILPKQHQKCQRQKEKSRRSNEDGTYWNDTTGQLRRRLRGRHRKCGENPPCGRNHRRPYTSQAKHKSSEGATDDVRRSRFTCLPPAAKGARSHFKHSMKRISRLSYRAREFHDRKRSGRGKKLEGSIGRGFGAQFFQNRQHISRQRRVEFHGCCSTRMNKSYGFCMERLPLNEL
jgi:hypothetical protein